MPIQYINPLVSPYVPLDVDFYDRKALEKQGRQDAANEAFYKQRMAGLNQVSYSEAAKQKYMQESDALYNQVIDKYSGNLSAGYADVLKAIQQDAASPYHSLTKIYGQKAAEYSNAVNTYGPEAIVRQPLPKDIIDKNGNWLDASDIDYDVERASDYLTVARNIFNGLKASAYETGWGQDPKYNFLLTKHSIEELTDDELKRMASLPEAIQAFKVAAPTYAYDNRPNVMNPQTGTSVFSTDEGIADFMYGTIAAREYRDVKSNSIQNPIVMAEIAAENERKKQQQKQTEEKQKKELAIEVNQKNIGMGETEEEVRKNVSSIFNSTVSKTPMPTINKFSRPSELSTTNTFKKTQAIEIAKQLKTKFPQYKSLSDEEVYTMYALNENLRKGMLHNDYFISNDAYEMNNFDNFLAGNTAESISFNGVMIDGKKLDENERTRSKILTELGLTKENVNNYIGNTRASFRYNPVNGEPEFATIINGKEVAVPVSASARKADFSAPAEVRKKTIEFNALSATGKNALSFENPNLQDYIMFQEAVADENGSIITYEPRVWKVNSDYKKELLTKLNKASNLVEATKIFSEELDVNNENIIGYQFAADYVDKKTKEAIAKYVTTTENRTTEVK